MDLAKYTNLFIEEATEHLAEMGRALLALEKDPTQREAIDITFRMAHSIKGMAASLGLEEINALAHRLEDRMQACRDAGRVEPDGLGELFEGLGDLERLVEGVRAGGSEKKKRIAP